MNSPSIQSNVPHSRFAIVPPSKVLDFIDDTTFRQDIREVPIPRIDPAQEQEIADLSDEATLLSAEADRLEIAAVRTAEHAISALTGHHGSLHLALAG